jgi:hypothetical protein
VVSELAQDQGRWGQAHDVFNQIRRLNLRAIDAKDHARACQYSFEEVCLKSIYNETNTVAPFDPDSPHWIIKNAISLARVLGIAETDAIKIVAPDENRS